MSESFPAQIIPSCGILDSLRGIDFDKAASLLKGTLGHLKVQLVLVVEMFANISMWYIAQAHGILDA